MSTNSKYSYGVEIEGFGDTDLYLLGKDIRIGLQAFSPDAFTLWLEGLAALPSKISTKCEVLRGSTTQSTMDFEIQGLDLADVEGRRYSRALLNFFWKARPRECGVLTAAVDSGAGGLSVAQVVGEPTIGAGDIIYIGREVIYVISATGADPNVLSVTRGILGSDSAAHELDDAKVYLSNPVKKGRRLTLWQYDHFTTAENARWRGIVEDYDLSDRTTILRIAGRDLLSVLSEYKLGRQRWTGTLAMSRLMQSDGDSTGTLWYHTTQNAPVVPYLPVYPSVPAGFFPGTEGFVWGDVIFKGMVVAIDGHAIGLRVGYPTENNPDPLYAAGWLHALNQGAVLELDGQYFDAEQTAEDHTAWEILIGDADNLLCYFYEAYGTARSDHPALMALNILMSTGSTRWDDTGSKTVGTNGPYDWLPGAWGLKVREAWVDADSFEALRQGIGEGLRARSYYLGADEDLVQGADCLGDLMQAQNAYFYMNGAAEIAGRRLEDPGAGNCDHVIEPEDILGGEDAGAIQDEQHLRFDKPVYSIALQTCPVGPGGDAARIIDNRVLGVLGLARHDGFGVQDSLKSTLMYGDPVVHELVASEVDVLGLLFRWRYFYTQDPLPMYKLTLITGAPLCMPGQWIELTHPFFFNDDLTRGFDAHRCLVLEQDWDLATGRQNLVIVDFAPATGADSLLNPSWKITDVTDSTHFEVDGDWYSEGNEELLLLVGSGYKLELWTADGQRRNSAAATRYLSSRSGVNCTLNAAWQSGGVDITPNEGDVVRVAYWTDRGDWVDQKYTWMGDTDGAVGGDIANAERWDV